MCCKNSQDRASIHSTIEKGKVYCCTKNFSINYNDPSLRIYEEFIYLEKFTSSKFQDVEVLLNEINILKDIRHDRVVAYYGSAEKDNHLHLFMELMTGVSLKKSNIKFL